MKATSERVRRTALLEKTNKEHPNPKELKALSDLLADNKKFELWRDVVSAGHLAEPMVIDNAHVTARLKECRKHRLQVMKKDLGYDEAPLLEKLLIRRPLLDFARKQGA